MTLIFHSLFGEIAQRYGMHLTRIALKLSFLAFHFVSHYFHFIFTTSTPYIQVPQGELHIQRPWAEMARECAHRFFFGLLWPRLVKTGDRWEEREEERTEEEYVAAI